VEWFIQCFHGQRACFVFFAFAGVIAIILHHDVFGHVKLADGRALFLIQQIDVFIADCVRKGIIVSAHRLIKPANGVAVFTRKRENAFAHKEVFALARLHENGVAPFENSPIGVICSIISQKHLFIFHIHELVV
jgi:hypothetical protein